MQIKGNPLANKRFNAVHYAGSSYDAVDISKVDNFMKLKDQSSLEELIPYSSHITDNLIVTRNHDLLATRQIDGAYFECVDEADLALLTDQLNTLIRSFDGKPVTFIRIVFGLEKKCDLYLTARSHSSTE